MSVKHKLSQSPKSGQLHSNGITDGVEDFLIVSIP